MFSGITIGLVRVVSLTRQEHLLSYDLEFPEEWLEGLQPGASVSVEGVCQTVVSISGTRVRFDAIEETLRLTTLGALQQNQRVSVERSFRYGDEIGGHIVSGHVRGRGRIVRFVEDGHRVSLTVAVPSEWGRYLSPKGFVALNGSSLTVGEVDVKLDGECLFDVHLIPETLRLTTLGAQSAGSEVNVELDSSTVAIVDTVERVLAERERLAQRSEKERR